MPTNASLPKFLLLTKSGESAPYHIDGRRSVPRTGTQGAKHREPPLNEIRGLVAVTLKTLGLGDAKSLGEHIVCIGYDMGVQFAFEGVSAIWLGEYGHIRFVDDAGQLLEIVRQKSCPDEESCVVAGNVADHF